MHLLPHPRSFELDPAGGWAPDGAPVETLDPSIRSQGYHLDVGADGIRLAASDDAGFRHGRATLAQLRHPANAPVGAPPGAGVACRIDDWPDFPVRGVMLDVSRDKVPTVETVLALVDRLASWKINQLQLYTEHTFAYAGHEEVWGPADAYTVDDITAIKSHCRRNGLDLVANQNTLGHFERWLRHDRYRPLAICPDGFTWMFGIRRRPTTLDPAKAGSWDLVRDLLDQLVGVVGSSLVHVGLDEPWELEAPRVAEWADWLKRIRKLDVLAGREVLVWGDVPSTRPDLIDEIPDGVTVCEWGYEDTHPFDQRLGALSDSGVKSWVCPGTSSWMSVSGRVDNMVGNITAAARAGLDHGSSGLLVTDWGDMGHLQYLPVSEPGLATAAAAGWCGASHDTLDLDALAGTLDVHAFDDPTGETGRALVALGRVHRMVTPRPPHISPVVAHLLLPQWPVGTGLSEGLTAAELDAVEACVTEALDGLGAARPRRPDGDLVKDELAAGAALLQLACHDARLRLRGDGTLASVPSAARTVMCGRLRDIVEEHRRLWLARNRPGGLDDSVAWFAHLEGCYETGQADRQWFGPLA